MKKRLLPIFLVCVLLLSTISSFADSSASTGEHAVAWATDSSMVTIDSGKVLSLSSDSYTAASGKKQGLFTVRYFLLNADQKSGDSILIHTPNDKYILIDAGLIGAGPQVISYLKKLGVTKLDAVFNTHPHGDHIGGMQEVIKNFPIGTYYKSKVVLDTYGKYNKTMQALYDRLIQVKTLVEGDEIDFGGGVTVHVYNPPDGLEKDYNDVYSFYGEAGRLNQTSLALMFTYKNVKMFFVGDLYQQGEINMINRYPAGTFDADVVHCGHHGADTSSSYEYIEATSPTMAVMSTNGLQSLNTYLNYTDYGSVVVANSVNGNLLITTDGTKASLHAYVEHQNDPTDTPKILESDQ